MDKEKEKLVSKLINRTMIDVLKWTEGDTLKNDVSSGNINYIYRVQNSKTGDSVIFKFADDETRVRPDGYLSPKRNTHEATCLEWYAKCEPNFVPKVLHVDRENHFFIMEDIKGGISLREALMRNLIHPNLGATIASFIVETSFPLLDIVRENKTEELPCYNTASSDLLELTEKLVFEDPYYNRRGRNIYTKGNEEFIKEALDNEELLEWVDKLKTKFKTYKQTLIHGDLHTGSILVRTTKDVICNKKGMEDFADLYVIDTEFAFYGPIAYDLGTVIAHLFFVQVFHFCNEESERERQKQFTQFQEINESFLALFRLCAEEKLREVLKNPKYKNKAFIENYVQEIMIEAMRYSGCEIIRRVVGSAKVPELTFFQDREDRISLERTLIKNAVNLVIYASGDGEVHY